MKQTLIHKYLAGETTASEERELKSMLQDLSELTREESSVLQLLQYSIEDDEEDIFAVDYTEEYEKVAHPRKTLRLWPFVAAACVAGALIFFLAPPKVDNGQTTTGKQIATVNEKSVETPKTEKTPAVMQVEAPKLLASAKAAAPKKVAEAKMADVKEEPVIAEAATDPEAAAREFASSYSVSNPERLKYTPEEMEALKRQARKKYEEWIQLEREILEYDIKQTTALINNNEETK